VIVLACPLNDETRGMAASRSLRPSSPRRSSVNIARGGLIDDAALLAALDAGKLATAILDVFHQEPLPETHAFWSHPRVRLTSHTSFSGSGVRSRWDQLFLDNIVRFVKGQPLTQVVDPATLYGTPMAVRAQLSSSAYPRIQPSSTS
jgi:phosphoglycerate dehydrogenase-like enzyme